MWIKRLRIASTSSFSTMNKNVGVIQDFRNISRKTGCNFRSYRSVRVSHCKSYHSRNWFWNKPKVSSKFQVWLLMIQIAVADKKTIFKLIKSTSLTNFSIWNNLGIVSRWDIEQVLEAFTIFFELTKFCTETEQIYHDFPFNESWFEHLNIRGLCVPRKMSAWSPIRNERISSIAPSIAVIGKVIHICSRYICKSRSIKSESQKTLKKDSVNIESWNTFRHI